MVKYSSQLVLIACVAMSTGVFSLPFILPEGAHPIANVDPKFHILKRDLYDGQDSDSFKREPEPFVLPPGASQVKNPIPGANYFKREPEPFVLLPGESQIKNPIPGLDYFKREPEPFVLLPGESQIKNPLPGFDYFKREPEPFVLLPGESQIKNPIPGFDYFKREPEPFILPEGARPLQNSNPLFHALKRGPEPEGIILINGWPVRVDKRSPIFFLDSAGLPVIPRNADLNVNARAEMSCMAIILGPDGRYHSACPPEE